MGDENLFYSEMFTITERHKTRVLNILPVALFVMNISAPRLTKENNFCHLLHLMNSFKFVINPYISTCNQIHRFQMFVLIKSNFVLSTLSNFQKKVYLYFPYINSLLFYGVLDKNILCSIC